jgi:CHAT domain-containing protein
VLHFSGHGRLSASAPWEARLELAAGQSLDFELLLARRPAPGLVVLSGCETGRALDAPADGLGLAEGFLAGGADQVLATTVEVRDERARTFVERFYRLGGARDPTTAFRLAALEARAADDSGWEEWKLFGRRAR